MEFLLKRSSKFVKERTTIAVVPNEEGLYPLTDGVQVEVGLKPVYWNFINRRGALDLPLTLLFQPRLETIVKPDGVQLDNLLLAAFGSPRPIPFDSKGVGRVRLTRSKVLEIRWDSF